MTEANGPNEVDLTTRFEFQYHDRTAFDRGLEIFKEILNRPFSGISLTLENVQPMVHCISVFVECSVNGAHGIQARVHATALRRADKKGALKPQEIRSSHKRHHGSTPTSPSEHSQETVGSRYQEYSLLVCVAFYKKLNGFSEKILLMTLMKSEVFKYYLIISFSRFLVS